jgi:8-oxo-dGTP pyrophosphatase MutT (NUDIX family)
MSKIGIKVRVSCIMFKGKQLITTKHFVEGYGEYFLLPGGGLEKGESPIETIKRECKEELGINVKVDRLLFFKSGYDKLKEETYLELIFLCVSSEENFQILDPDNTVKEVCFFDNEEELKKVNFFPKQLISKIFKDLPLETEFLGKFDYPEN